MSYTVFALKWRPKSFDEIVGQNHIVTTLKNALVKNRLAHAYLFAGPRGVGKTSTARILSKALNCKDGPTVNPCQKCASCTEISQGRSLDVIEIDGASNRGIDEIRVIRENVKFSPTAGKFKVYIIDEVHMLTPEAFNALLKTLEEPPEFVKFVFATTQPHKVPATILSRCQRLDFRRIPALEVIAQLEKIVTQEKLEVDKEALFAIARSSDGSLRDAESLLDQLISFAKDRVSLKDIVSVLGIVEQEALFEITDKLIQKDAKRTLELFNNIIDQGKDIGVFLNNLIEHFRNLMLAKVTRADSKLLDLPQEICDRLLQQAESFSLEEIFSVFNILVNTQEMAKRLDFLRIPLELSLVRLAQEKRQTLPNYSAPSAPKDTRVNNPGPLKEESPDFASLDKLKDIWQNIIIALGRVKMSLATYLNEGSPLKLEHNILTISFPDNYSLHKESLEKKENKLIIEKIVSELCNTNIKLNFILSQRKIEDDSIEDNFLKSALQTFKARVIRD